MKLKLVFALVLIAVPASAQQRVFDNEADLTSRINEQCDAQRRIAAGKDPLNVIGGPQNVPPADPAYPVIQAYTRLQGQSQIDTLNGRLGLLGKPPIACAP